MIKDSQIIELFTYISELKDGEPLNYEAVFYRNPEYSVREYDD